MRSVEDHTGKGGTIPPKREINQHMHRKHNGHEPLMGSTLQRLVAHEELHHDTECDHTHDDYELPAQWSPVSGG